MSEKSDLTLFESAHAPAPENRPAGRPKGATNKRAADLRAFIAATYGRSPGEQLARAVMVDAETLAKANGSMPRALALIAKEYAALLSCKPLEAFKEIRAMMGDLMPYVHQRLPQAIEIDARNVFSLNIAAPSVGPAGGQVLDLRPAQYRMKNPIETDAAPAAIDEVGSNPTKEQGNENAGS